MKVPIFIFLVFLSYSSSYVFIFSSASFSPNGNIVENVDFTGYSEKK